MQNITEIESKHYSNISQGYLRQFSNIIFENVERLLDQNFKTCVHGYPQFSSIIFENAMKSREIGF